MELHSLGGLLIFSIGKVLVILLVVKILINEMERLNSKIPLVQICGIMYSFLFSVCVCMRARVRACV